MKKVLFALIFILCLFPLFAGGQGEKIMVVDDFRDYADWTKVNMEPITGDATGVLGPAHERAEGFREIYVNDIGRAVATGEKPHPYPVGTVVVKESYAADGTMKGDMSNLTVMTKKEKGYDSKNGDWEYLMANPGFEVMDQGKIGMCIGCHTAAADTDFVFWNSKM